MENYSYNSYPDSGNSSPRSREIDFENPPPWEDNQSQNPLNYKAKFMCSYGGKIQPRPHDNQLSYIGGETKIFSVDRNIKFASMISKVASLCGGDTEVSFKYQLPGEELDALISVSNDDDLEHMMHEYDRLYRPSAKPARMRLFIFPVSGPSSSFSSEAEKSDRERFVEALNSGSGQGAEKNAGVPPNKVDFLFGIEKGMAPPLVPVKIQNIVPPEPVAPLPLPPPQIPEIVGSDPVVNHVEMQRQLQELQRLQIRDQEEQYRKKIDDQNNSVPCAAGGYFAHKLPEQTLSVSLPVSVQQSAHPGYWPEKQISGAGYTANITNAPVPTHLSEHRVYMVPAPPPGTFYHAPSPISATAPPRPQPQQMVRSVTGQGGQGGYYTNVQRMPTEMYREHAVYNMATAAAPTMSHPPPISAVQQQVAQTGGLTEPAYAQVPGYDRQVHYTGPGGMMLPPQYQGVGVAVSDEMRAAAAESKVALAPKISQASI